MLDAGIEDEFVFSGRLDNLAMSFCSLQALLDVHGTPDSLANSSTVKAVALFDHEEVGSSSAQGSRQLTPTPSPFPILMPAPAFLARAWMKRATALII